MRRGTQKKKKLQRLCLGELGPHVIHRLLFGKVGEKLKLKLIDKIVKHGSEFWLFFPQYTHTTSIQTQPQRAEIKNLLQRKFSQQHWIKSNNQF